MTDKLTIQYEDTPACWCAYYDPEGPIGCGKDREKAVIDLMEQIEDGYCRRLDRLDAAVAALSGKPSHQTRDALPTVRSTGTDLVLTVPDCASSPGGGSAVFHPSGEIAKTMLGWLSGKPFPVAAEPIGVHIQGDGPFDKRDVHNQGHSK